MVIILIMKKITLVVFAMLIVLAGCTGGNGSASGAGRESRAAGGGQPARPKITVTVYDRGNVPASEGTIENNRWTRWINENGPVDVTFVAIPRVNPQQKLNTLFASGTAPDLIFEYNPNIKTLLYQQGMVMPLKQLKNCIRLPKPLLNVTLTETA